MAHRPAINLRRSPEALLSPEQRLPTIVLLFVVIAAAIYILVQLQIMIGDLKRVDSRLQTLSVMSRQFEDTNRSLTLTNALLAETNAKIDATNKKLNATNDSLRGTHADLKALAGIRGDIHEMAHKLSGSFLFRGVK